MMRDEDLLEAWARGDLEAGSELFHRYYDGLWRFFRNRVDTAVEDLVQNTLLECVRSREQLRRTVSFRSFLFGIARNKLMHDLRSRLRRGKAFDRLEAQAQPCYSSGGGFLVRHEEQKILLAALRSLPLPMQLALQLRYWEGLSHSEIADCLGLAPEGVKSRLRRAKDRLRSEIAQVAQGPRLYSTLTRLDDWARSMASRSPQQ